MYCEICAPPRALTLNYRIILCPALLSPKEYEMEIPSTPHDLTTKKIKQNIVNIEGQNICLNDLTCERIAELTSEQKDELNLCVLVVYMVFWF